MRKRIIAPSVLSLDYSQFEKQCNQLNESKAEYLHFDVMDGHFVKNLTFGPDILKGFRKACPNLLMDVHLMVENPKMFIEPFVKAGADIITFHVEAMNRHEEIFELINLIHSYGIKAGIVLKPKTDVKEYDIFLDKIDMILIMSVEPGFGGQKFMKEMLSKVEYLRQVIDTHHYSCLIEIDGGINRETYQSAVDAGVDVLVAGSYVFKGNIQENIWQLLK